MDKRKTKHKAIGARSIISIDDGQAALYSGKQTNVTFIMLHVFPKCDMN